MATQNQADPDAAAREAIAYLSALAMSAEYPSPAPLGARDAVILRDAADVIRRLIRERKP